MVRATFRRIAPVVAKGIVSIALIALLIRGVDVAAVLEHLRAVDARAVAVAVVMTTAIALLHAGRWQVILKTMGHGRFLAFGGALRLVLIGYFFNQTLPSTVGGDAFRIWGAYRAGIRAGDAFASVVVDRIFALVSLLLMIVLGLPWLFDIVVAPTARAVVILVIAGGAAGMAVLLLLGRFASHLQRWRLTRFMLQISEGCRALLRDPARTLAVAVLTIAGYAALSYVVYILARGLDVPLELGNSLLLIPLVTLVTLLPVSIAGWGVREGAMVVALGLIGVPAVKALSLSILSGLVVMASGLVGGAVWLVTHRHGQAAGAEHAPLHLRE